jgi:hypothetical protein
MSTSVGQLTIDMAANVLRLQKDMDAARSIVERSTKAIESAVSNTLGFLGVGLSAAAFTTWIKGAIDAADETNKMAQKMGLAVKDVGGLELAFKQSGLQAGDMTTSIAKLAKGVAEGNIGLRALGINTTAVGGGLKDTKTILYEVADKFKDMPDGVNKTALAIEIFGKSGAQMIPLLNGGAQAMREMAEMADKLGLSIDEKTAKSAEQFNDTLELISLGSRGYANQLMGHLLPALNSVASAFLETKTSGDGAASSGGKLKVIADVLGFALRGLYTAGVGIIEVFTTIGKTWGMVFAALAAALRGDFSGAMEVIRAGMADIGNGWRSTAASVKAAWSDQSSAAVEAGAKIIGIGRNLLAEQKAREEAAKKGADAAKKAMEEFIRLREKLLGKESGVDADFIKTLQMIEVQGRKFGLTLAEITHLKELYIKTQPYMVKALEAERKQTEEAAEAYDNLLKSIRDRIEDIDKEAEKERDAAKAIGLTRVQVAALEAAKLREMAISKERRAGVMDDIDLSGQMSKALRDEAAALRNKAAAVEDRAKREDAYDEEKKRLEETKDLIKSMDETAHDVFTNIWKGGSDVWRKLKDTAKATFFDWLYSMTVRKWIINIGTSVTGGGSTGSSILQAVSGGGGGGGILSTLGSLGGLLGTFGGGLSAGFGGLMGSIGSLFGAAGTGATLGGAMSAGTIALGSGNILGALGTFAGALGPIALAVGLIASFMQRKGGDKSDGVFGTINSGIGQGDRSTELDSAVATAAGGIQTMFDQITGSMGITGTGVNFGMGVSTDPKGDSPTFLDVTASRNGQTIWTELNRNVGRSEQELKDAITKAGSAAVIGGLKAISDTLPEAVQAVLSSGGTADEQITQLTAIIDSANAFRAAAEAWPLSQIKGLSFDVSAALVSLMGGLQESLNLTSTYIQNFYSEEEQRAQAVRNIQKVLADAGAAYSTSMIEAATREQFRALVEAQDLTTEAGRMMYAALMRVAGAFAELHPVVEEVAEEVVVEVTTIFDTINERLAANRAAAAEFTQQARGIMTGNLSNAVQAAQAELDNLRKQYDAAVLVDNQRKVANLERARAEAASLRALSDQYALTGRSIRDSAAISSKMLASATPANAAEAAQAYMANARDGATSQLDYILRIAQGRSVLNNQAKSVEERAVVAMNTNTASLEALTEALRAAERKLGVAQFNQSTFNPNANTPGTQEYTDAQNRRWVGFHMSRMGSQAGSWDEYIRQMGWSTADVERFTALYNQYAPQVEAEQNLWNQMVPSYDVGTSWVPHDGPAMLHAGEAVLTRSENQQRLSGDKDVVDLLETLNLRMARVEDDNKRMRLVLEGAAKGEVTLTTSGG